jgi:MshEN domain
VPAAAERNDDGRRRIRVSETTRMRDYFLRLGAKAEIVESNVVAVELAEDDDGNVEEYVRTWSTINGIEAVPENHEPPALRVLRPFFPGRPRLGEMLVARGLLADAQLKEALAESRMTGALLGNVLLSRGWLFEDELARMLAIQLDVPYVNLRLTGVDQAVARAMPSATGIQFGVIPIGVSCGQIRVAFGDPTDDGAQEAVGRYIQDPDVVVSELSDITAAWRRIDAVHVRRGSGPPRT